MNNKESFNLISSFENKVKTGLFNCGVDLSDKVKGMRRIGVAVSGGADSISLLYSLVSILLKKNDQNINNKLINSIYVITVNHFIRPKEETCGDADFVIKTCQKLKSRGYNVECSLVALQPGEVEMLAKKRQAGIEEAARFLRYNIFQQFIDKNNLEFLCLAHNKNDQLETILMRFLQGSNVESAGGIKISREKFIRPLLNISRLEIEEYLVSCGVHWREDKTNDDTNYFRNNVRHNLIPFLDSHFSGWKRAVLSGAEKACDDGEFIKNCVLKFPIYFDNSNNVNLEKVSFNKKDFLNEFIAIQKRIIVRACNLIGENKRIPNVFLQDVILSLKNSSSDFSKIYDNIEIEVKKEIIFVKKYIKKDTDFNFFDIIEDSGTYDFPFGKLSVTFDNYCVYVSINGCNSFIGADFNLPICIRSFMPGDEIKNNNGEMKKISDIFSDWHVCEAHRKIIPIIYKLNDNSEAIELKCILGKFLGYKDWIVK